MTITYDVKNDVCVKEELTIFKLITYETNIMTLFLNS